MSDFDNNRIVDAVNFYLNTESVGALMITGEWGCGKTYFVENTLFKKLKEQEKIPVKVSLFGMPSLTELPKQICLEYQKNKHIEDNNENIKVWVDGIVNGVQKLPSVQKIIGDVLDNATFLYSFIDKNKVVVFIDDIERAIEKGSDVNEILGVVNSLVENYKLKVILVANEGHISANSEGTLIFKEKVIDKTLVYKPNIIEIYKTLVENVAEKEHFGRMMKLDNMQSIIDPAKAIDNNLRKDLENIRILKFAINHFYPIYENAIGEKQLSKWELDVAKYYWAFVVAISIEYKLNNVSYDDSRSLDNYQPVPDFGKVELDATDEVSYDDLTSDQKDNEVKINKQSADWKFAGNFYHRYFSSRGLRYVFFTEIFDNITSGKIINFDALRKQTEEIFPKEKDKRIEAGAVLSDLLTEMYSKTNDEIVESLKLMYSYFQQCLYVSPVDIINAYTYLSHYSGLIGINKEKLAKEAEDIVTHVYQNNDVNHLMLSNIQIIKDQIHPNTQHLADFIQQTIEQKLIEGNEQEQANLHELFINNMDEFCKQLVVFEMQSPRFFNIPILHKISKDEIKAKVQNVQPNDVRMLKYLIDKRLEQNRALLNVEKPFFESLKFELEATCKDKNKPTDYMIADFLLPAVKQCIDKLNELEDHQGSKNGNDDIEG